jgi:elongation factor P--(R)-beta-lysine ligase
MLLNGGHFLKDVEGAVRLDGAAELFMDLQSGDLLQVLVSQVKGGLHQCTQSRKTHASIGERGRPRPHAVEFAKFTDQVRRYLRNRGLSEIFTPTLVTCPGLEPTLEAFSTKVTRGPVSDTRYLPTSPEIHMKKALAKGLTDIFEIRPCFRRGEFSEHHSNEFLMLEWYRGFADLDLVIEDLELMLEALGAKTKVRVTDFRALFKEVLDFDLGPRTPPEEMRLLAVKMNIDFDPGDTFTDLFHRLMIAHIEPAMAKMGPLVVRRFPPAMAALARLDEDGWADRFEFYWNGLEIANAFNEVTDPNEQTRRWDLEMMERRRLGTEKLPPDQELIEALKVGIPPTGGIALGLERLYMALYGVSNIRELQLFGP